MSLDHSHYAAFFSMLIQARYRDILPKDSLPKDSLPKGQFADGQFDERTFCRKDILPKGQFAENVTHFSTM